MTFDEKFAVGNWIELIPREPALPGLVLVGQICGADLPEFRIAANTPSGVIDFRVDRNAELVVSIESRRVYEVGRVMTPEDYLNAAIWSGPLQ